MIARFRNFLHLSALTCSLPHPEGISTYCQWSTSPSWVPLPLKPDFWALAVRTGRKLWEKKKNALNLLKEETLGCLKSCSFALRISWSANSEQHSWQFMVHARTWPSRWAWSCLSVQTRVCSLSLWVLWRTVWLCLKIKPFQCIHFWGKLSKTSSRKFA